MNGLGVLFLFALFPGVPCWLWWREETRRERPDVQFSEARAALRRACGERIHETKGER